jgi:hypothetical protein
MASTVTIPQGAAAPVTFGVDIYSDNVPLTTVTAVEFEVMRWPDQSTAVWPATIATGTTLGHLFALYILAPDGSDMPAGDTRAAVTAILTLPGGSIQASVVNIYSPNQANYLETNMLVGTARAIGNVFITGAPLATQPTIVIPSTSPGQAASGFITAVNASAGVCTVEMPLNPTADALCGIQDVNGFFQLNPCQLVSQGGGVTTYGQLSSGGLGYAANVALVGNGAAATYYFRFNAALNAWCWA